MIRRLSLPLFLTAAFAFSSCSIIKSVPIPFVGGDSQSSSASDPQLGFTQATILRTGHTLDLSVYEGLRSPNRIYRDSVVVDANGLVTLAKGVKAKVGGLTAIAAVKNIEGAFRNRVGGGIVQVQVNSIEEVPTITVDGAVKNPAVIQWFSGISLSGVLPYVGGRDLKSSGRAVYVTHKGVRKFHADTIGANDAVELEPGDVVHFSDDL
jgi:protein involved in polysaccharide export with SLBB domain